MATRSFCLTIIIFCVSVSVCSAQTRRLVGRVSDARSGLPIANGEVSVRGSAEHDALRPDGVFVLTIPQRTVSVIVEAPGYRAKTIAVPVGRYAAIVELEPDIIALERIVVGGRRDRRVRSGAGSPIGQVDGSELTAIPVSGVKLALLGRTAAADIRVNSGVPGGDVHLAVRGVPTILGNSKPIYVVDGIVASDVSISSGLTDIAGGQLPASGRIVDLNVHDIASIEVLSGVKAATIYGSIGAAGVVVIRTKRGG